MYRPEIDVNGTKTRILCDQIYTVDPSRLGELKGGIADVLAGTVVIGLPACEAGTSRGFGHGGPHRPLVRHPAR
ncbi:hypothetical protein [Nocardia huaxiensis]|uniref:hypothetical protein n=1 Tax=Nocardia huaxiensis TaxID=2755382 RepID=UPI0030B84007